MTIKKLSLLLIIFCIGVSYTNAQKAKVQTAYNYYKEPYQQYDKAKEAIDEAILNEQSKGMPKTWYYRGLIYQSLYKSEKYGSLCDNCLKTAFESFQKANELDPKNEWADEITHVRIPFLANKVFDSGVNAFKEKRFEQALADFELVHKMSPGDTSVLLNSAYSAERSGNIEKAKMYYTQLIGMKYSDENIYLSLSNIYKAEKDTLKALSTIKDGRIVFPESMNLMLAEINLLLAMGRNEEATQALDAATKKDPNNENLYLALGSTYDNLANPRDNNRKELPKPKNYNEYVSKAEEAYKKGLSINPDNYELNYNLGALYFNQAAEMANQANAIKSDAEFAKAKEQYENKFRDAQPYLEKSLEKNPRKTEDDISTYEGTLISLKQLYARLGETEKYNKIKALLDQK
jgi:tetratricopeptide (TPR) repeat protein